MTTLRDISKRLGLSVTQVSRALNGHSDVNEDTRLRVQAAAKALNYQPNLSARKLVSGRSGMVGLVLPGIPDSPVDALFVQIVGGLSRHFSARGMQFVLHIASPDEDIVKVYERLINAGSLDGFVLIEPTEKDPRIAYLRKRKVPFVLHGRQGPLADHPYFDIDNEEVGYRLTRHLLDLGHRRIGFLNGVSGRTFADARTLGYRRALSEAGVSVRADHLVSGEMTEGFGLLSTVTLLTSKAPPTALICGNLLITKGVMAALSALALSVPRDVSVVAHDDVLPGVTPGSFAVPMTTTESPLAQSWEPLADLLARAINGEPLAGLQRLGSLTLVERASSAPPASA